MRSTIVQLNVWHDDITSAEEAIVMPSGCTRALVSEPEMRHQTGRGRTAQQPSISAGTDIQRKAVRHQS